MVKTSYANFIAVFLYSLMPSSDGETYTYEDVELRRIFPNEFTQDVVMRTGSADPTQLGRYEELESYFNHPKLDTNSHFEELVCYQKNSTKFCRLNLERYTPEEDAYYQSPREESHVDRRRVYCFMLLCFTEDELERVVASFALE